MVYCKDISTIMIRLIVCSIHITLPRKFSGNSEKLLPFFWFFKEEKTRYFTSLLFYTIIIVMQYVFFLNPVQENIKISRRHHIYYPELIDSFGMRESKKKREASERDDKIMIIEKRLENVYTCMHAWEKEKKREHEPRNATHQFDEQHHVVTDTQKQKSCK